LTLRCRKLGPKCLGTGGDAAEKGAAKRAIMGLQPRGLVVIGEFLQALDAAEYMYYRYLEGKYVKVYSSLHIKEAVRNYRREGVPLEDLRIAYQLWLLGKPAEKLLGVDYSWASIVQGTKYLPSVKGVEHVAG